jgi:hypothetical protein
MPSPVRSALLALLLAASAAAAEPVVTQSTAQLMPHQLLELTFVDDGGYADPDRDVSIEVRLHPPGGRDRAVGGFFYGSSKPMTATVTGGTDAKGRPIASSRWRCDPPDTWKARFAPDELGVWTYAWTFTDLHGLRAAGTGSFTVVAGRVPQAGRLRIDAGNRFRLVNDDGSAFNPVGFQSGLNHKPGTMTALDSFAMEGPFRLSDSKGPVPAGPLFAPGPSMGGQSAGEFFGRMSRAGFNLWRFSPANACSINLFADPGNERMQSLDHIRFEQGIMIDEMLTTVRSYDIRVMYGFFGYLDVGANEPLGEGPIPALQAEKIAKVKRLIKYSVDRWGAYVDIWELLNEQKATAAWYAIMVPYLKEIDPYRKPVTTSWERPELDGIDINSPHRYQSEPDVASDDLVALWAANNKKPGKAVVMGEAGNSIKCDRSLGCGGVWDPLSARRLRIRLWTAYCKEISFIFWLTDYAKDGHFMNLWVGPEERQYVHAMQDFAGRLDARVAMTDIPLGGPAAAVHAFGLRSDRHAAVYLHHVACAACAAAGRDPKVEHDPAKGVWDHDPGLVRGLAVTVDVPVDATGYWYDPANAAIVQRIPLGAGLRSIAVPPFSIDLALLVTADGAPDIDRDGKANDEDDDDDNDGVPDGLDAFPLEREETADADHDRIGDNLDADLDGDGVGDDRDGDGIPDCEEADWDGDGVPNHRDAFPRDPKESSDLDGDGTGDNADADKDGDGFSDAEERAAGTSPLDATVFPASG